MSYLKPVRTYHQPSEADVDKAFLESHGLTVCLMNANTARSELGAPFFIQLQVMEEEHDRAIALLRAANPERFGSPARVAEIDRQIRRSVFVFLLGAILAGAACYLLLPASIPPEVGTGIAAILGGILALRLARQKPPPSDRRPESDVEPDPQISN